jgi:hypothetical protein
MGYVELTYAIKHRLSYASVRNDDGNFVSANLNLPGTKQPTLRFTPQALSGIYLGTIKKWNDPAIAETNPEAKLTSADIVIIHRVRVWLCSAAVRDSTAEINWLLGLCFAISPTLAREDPSFLRACSFSNSAIAWRHFLLDIRIRM